ILLATGVVTAHSANTEATADRSKGADLPESDQTRRPSGYQPAGLRAFLSIRSVAFPAHWLRLAGSSIPLSIEPNTNGGRSQRPSDSPRWLPLLHRSC